MRIKDGGKCATAKQVAYIEMLKRELASDVPKIDKNLSVDDASRVIEELLSKARNVNGHKANGQCVKINEPRLGLAIKECFRTWKNSGRDMYRANRGLFKDEVIQTYRLFTEICDDLQNSLTKNEIEK